MASIAAFSSGVSLISTSLLPLARSILIRPFLTCWWPSRTTSQRRDTASSANSTNRCLRPDFPVIAVLLDFLIGPAVVALRLGQFCLLHVRGGIDRYQRRHRRLRRWPATAAARPRPQGGQQAPIKGLPVGNRLVTRRQEDDLLQRPKSAAL